MELKKLLKEMGKYDIISKSIVNTDKRERVHNGKIKTKKGIYMRYGRCYLPW